MRTNCGPSLTKPLLESLLRLLVPSSSASRTAERLVRSPWRRVPVRRVLLGQSVGRNGRSGHELLSIYRVVRFGGKPFPSLLRVIKLYTILVGCVTN